MVILLKTLTVTLHLQRQVFLSLIIYYTVPAQITEPGSEEKRVCHASDVKYTSYFLCVNLSDISESQGI